MSGGHFGSPVYARGSGSKPASSRRRRPAAFKSELRAETAPNRAQVPSHGFLSGWAGLWEDTKKNLAPDLWVHFRPSGAGPRRALEALARDPVSQIEQVAQQISLGDQI